MKQFLIINLLLLSGCTQFSKKSNDIQTTESNYKIFIDTIDKPTNKVLDIINCPITPEIEDNMQVPQIYKTNNLRKKVGYASFAKGQFIRITGIITDSFCVPIKNATIQIWHTDANGKYKSIPDNGYLNDSLLYSKQNERFTILDNDDIADENFTGSGSTISDNLGRFTFLSIMPGGSEPIVNFRVIHKDFNSLKTIMYFYQDPNINQSLVATKLGYIETDQYKEDVYQCNITINGKNKYTDY
jgi:protocatechuate 3,4-dioxygenase beta subunit